MMAVLCVHGFTFLACHCTVQSLLTITTSQKKLFGGIVIIDTNGILRMAGSKKPHVHGDDDGGDDDDDDDGGQKFCQQKANVCV